MCGWLEILHRSITLIVRFCLILQESNEYTKYHFGQLDYFQKESPVFPVNVLAEVVFCKSN